MTEYVPEDTRPSAAEVEQRVEDTIGREVTGVLVDEDGLRKVILGEGDELTDQELQQLSNEFGRSFHERSRGQGRGP